ncbi:tagatose 1,6-diphosphate aldolase [Albidovulum sp.]|uniref:tagatose 1,6-diphosphate aldolase n=1 Tax=Albidovulum sp. TaxID=1872424 RepID=UPI0039B918F7
MNEIAPMELSAGKLWSLRRLSDRKGFFKMNAVDQRSAVEMLVASKKADGVATYTDIGLLKQALIQELSPRCTAIQVDPNYAYPYAYQSLDPGKGLIVAAEKGSSEEDAGGRRNFLLDDWSVAKIKRLGADAVKITLWYRPDASAETLRHQQAFVEAVGTECRRHDIAFLICPVRYAFPGEAEPQNWELSKHIDISKDTIRELSKERYGLDLFQLENPLTDSALVELDPSTPESRAVQNTYDEIGSLLNHPWVMMSAGSGQEAYRRTLTYAFRAGASGYLAGRVVWGSAASKFPDIGAIRGEIRQSGIPFIKEMQDLLEATGCPWPSKFDPEGILHMRGQGPDFISAYPTS